MNNQVYVLVAMILMGVVTLGLRALPFVAGPWLRRHRMVGQLGRFLPLAIMVLLALHTAWGHAQARRALPWAEAAAIVLVVLLQWRFRQTLLSIAAGTVVYMLLIGL
ncbi:MAG TPA: AzlD domain-containing protein [Wenzhouxiangella sp.]|nr:AzlD domain-containing protein [Wenzhouxiangella sp.]